LDKGKVLARLEKKMCGRKGKKGFAVRNIFNFSSVLLHLNEMKL